MSNWAKLRVGLGVAFLLFIGYSGITGGLQQLGVTATLGQRLQTAMQLVFGALAVAVLGALVTRRRWTRLLLLAWAAALTIGGGVAPIVWGGSGLLPALAAAVAIALLAWLTLWAVKPAITISPEFARAPAAGGR